MRTLYLIDPSLLVDESSYLVNCKIKYFKGSNSILAGVDADTVNVNNCLIIHSSARSIEGSKGLLYHIINEQLPILIRENTIRSDVRLPEKIHLCSQLDRDGKEDWEVAVGKNTFSYKEINSMLLSKQHRVSKTI